MNDRVLRLTGIVLSLAGLAIASYLTYGHYHGGSTACVIGHGCQIVQTSPWSEIAGVPVALLGAITYALLLVSFFIPGEMIRLGAAGVTLGAFGFSLYLTYREVFTLNTICPWCVASAVVMTLLVVVTIGRVLTAPVNNSRARADST